MYGFSATTHNQIGLVNKTLLYRSKMTNGLFTKNGTIKMIYIRHTLGR